MTVQRLIGTFGPMESDFPPMSLMAGGRNGIDTIRIDVIDNPGTVFPG